MTPIHEFLEFLKKTNEAIIQRNPEIEKFVSMKELKSLIVFLEECDKSNKFNIRKFDEFFVACRPKFVELLSGGFIWFDEFKEEGKRRDFLRRFDEFKTRISHYVEHYGEAFKTVPSQLKVMIVKPLPNHEVYVGYGASPRLDVEAVAIGPNAETFNNMNDDVEWEKGGYIFRWFICLKDDKGNLIKEKDVDMSRKAYLKKDIVMKAESGQTTTLKVKLGSRPYPKSIDIHKVIAEAEIPIHFIRTHSPGYHSRYHLPSSISMSIEEVKLIAVLNHWWQEEKLNVNFLWHLLGKMHLKVQRCRLELETTEVLTEKIIIKNDSQGFWISLAQKGKNELLVAPMEIFANELIKITGWERLYSGVDNVPEKFRVVRFYRIAQIKDAGHGKYEVAVNGNMLLDNHPDPHFPLPETYESLVAKEPAVPEPTITLKLLKSGNKFYLQEEINIEVNINNLEIIAQNSFSLLELTNANGTHSGNWNIKKKLYSWQLSSNHWEVEIKAKDLEFGEHHIVFELHDIFGDDRHLYSNILSIKIVRDCNIAIKEPKDRSRFYLNETLEFHALIQGSDTPKKELSYRFYKKPMQVLLEGTTKHHDIIMRTNAVELGEGPHVIIFELIDPFETGENLSSNELRIEIVGRMRAEILSPQNNSRFFTDEQIALKAKIENFAIIAGMYNCSWVKLEGSTKKLIVPDYELKSNEVSYSITASNIGQGTHQICIIITKNTPKREEVLISKPITIYIIKKTLLHKIKIRKK